MKKEVVVCDRCLEEGVVVLAEDRCSYCGGDYCKRHERHLNIEVWIDSGASLRGSTIERIAVCSLCAEILILANDRTLLKDIIKAAIPVVSEKMKSVIKQGAEAYKKVRKAKQKEATSKK